uniref:Uncharacterized protein n=1 Tax=Arundo donax TaxID=35708 RepID=A0A0A9AEX4_ARUDO
MAVVWFTWGWIMGLSLLI